MESKANAASSCLFASFPPFAGPDARATVATKTKKTVKDGKVVKEERTEDIEEEIPLKKTTMLTKEKEAPLTAENNVADEHPPIDKRIYIGAGVVALSALAVGLYVGLRSRH